MFAKGWVLSRPDHQVHIDRDVRITLRDGVELDCDIFRPADGDPCPAIIGLHGYSKAKEVTPSFPIAMGAGRNGDVEAGDPLFYARRGYAHVIVNARGTGKSGGIYDYQGPVETADGVEVVEWAAKQPWCDGSVALAGQSYFAIMALRVAAQRPPSLKTIYAPWGRASSYRGYYLGGILAARFLSFWPLSLANLRYESQGPGYLGHEEFQARLDAARRDRDITQHPELAAALRSQERPAHALMADFLVHPLANEQFWRDRDADVSQIEVPSLLGACWASYGLHLPGALLNYNEMTAPRKLLVGPPLYLDRPIYQLGYDHLRWFDEHLKGIDTGLMEEPAVRVFVPGKNEWLEAEEWPLPQTHWTPFNLHANGLLSEHEFFPNEGSTCFEHSYNTRGSIQFTSPKLVERTTIVGPARLELYASCTDEEVLWFVSLWDVSENEEPRILTRGWLRATLAFVDQDHSTPWEAHHPYSARRPVARGEVCRYDINLSALSYSFAPGHRIALKISCSDDEPTRGPHGMGTGRVTRTEPAWITVEHNFEHPSCVYLPVVEGNVIGTFMSGGDLAGGPG
ncbi:MAG TPA: CocE/NonD family hydrolase [Solirubrobacteraceae bacterium]